MPELLPQPARRPRWVLSCTGLASAVDPGELALLGTEDVNATARVSLYRTRIGFRLVFDDTGVFDISGDGRMVHWTAPPNVNLDSVRKDVLGRVAAVCLQLDGMSVLHGSAVRIGREAIVFLAPKFHGKSTTAAALVDRGARLLADDLVAVTADGLPHIAPSVPVVQLWRDSAARVAQRDASDRGNGTSIKIQRGWDDTRRRATAPVRFGAAYLLAPFLDDPVRHVQRVQLRAVAAPLALLGQAKVGALLGTAWRSRMLSRLTAIAATVPVYQLDLPRDYGRLDELTDTIWKWHAPTRITAPVAVSSA